MEVIKFHPYIQDILDKFVDVHPNFLNGVKTVLEYLKGKMVIEDKLVLIEGVENLFELLKDLDLEIYGIIVFKTERGSAYLWDSASGVSIRFDIHANKSYVLRDPSYKCTFKENNIAVVDPSIGAMPIEEFSDGRLHKGTLITEMSRIPLDV